MMSETEATPPDADGIWHRKPQRSGFAERTITPDLPNQNEDQKPEWRSGTDLEWPDGRRNGVPEAGIKEWF